MDVHSDMVEPATPVLSYESVRLWRAEDSGYHTFTPSSIDCSELSTENIDPLGGPGPIRRGNNHNLYRVTPESNPRLGYQYSFTKNTFNENFLDRPSKRRGIKRPYQDETDTNDVSYSSIPTPTSVIAGQIQKLRVNDSANLSGNFSLSPYSDYADSSSIYTFNSLSFPSTPVKKICKSSCKLNKLKSNHKSSPLRPINNVNCPPRKFARQLDFEIHSLACEPQSLQVVKPSPCAVKGPLQFKPNQKIDIIKMLHETVLCVPAINKIIGYLSPADIFNFTLVSPIWLQICEDVIEGREKLKKYLKLSKENQENKKHNSTPNHASDMVRRKLKEIHNIEHTQSASYSPSSPPGSPRTMRFKTFSRSASLDTRIQVACVRCQQPAKVTEEASGEMWVECTRATCAYQFCKYCSCGRHPGKSCIRYDLDGPSPSKRKKKSCAAGSKQSKTNLRRLLIK